MTEVVLKHELANAKRGRRLGSDRQCGCDAELGTEVIGHQENVVAQRLDLLRLLAPLSRGIGALRLDREAKWSGRMCCQVCSLHCQPIMREPLTSPAHRCP